MDAEWISLVAGIVISLGFSYIPGLNTKYASQSEDKKKLIMIGVLFAVALIAFGLACAGWLADLTGVVITCDKPGIVLIIKAFVLAAIANQTTYKLTMLPKSVKAAKARG